MKTQWTTRELCKLLGIPYQTVTGWISKGVFQASIRPASGSGRGKHQLFSFDDLVIVALVKALRDGGLEVDRVRKIIEDLRAGDLAKLMDTSKLVLFGKSGGLMVDDADEFAQVAEGSAAAPLTLVIEVGAVIRDLKKRVRKKGKGHAKCRK